MKRLLARMVPLLVLGTIINVIVAWGCAVAAHGKPGQPVAYHNPRGTDPLVIFIVEHFGFEAVYGCGRSGTFLSRTPNDAHEYRGRAWWPDEALRTLLANYAVATGWPALSLIATCTTTVDPTKEEVDDGSQYILTLHNGILLSREPLPWSFQPRPLILPLRILWPGFLLNTLFYTAIITALSLAPARIRRTLRRHRNLCLHCGHDRRGNPNAPCPECGAP